MRAGWARWWHRGEDGLLVNARVVVEAAGRASRPLMVALGVVVAVTGVFPMLQIILVSAVIGRIPVALNGDGAALRELYGGLALLAASYFVAQVAPAAQWSLGRVLGARMDVQARRDVMTAALRPPGLAHIEETAVAEASTLARESRSATFGPDDAVRGLASLLSGRVQGVIAAVVLAGFHWWAPVVLFLTFLPWDGYFRAEHRKVARSWVERTPDQARAAYFRQLGTDAAAGKEVRVFGLAEFVRDRFAAHFVAGMAPLWRERTTDSRRFLPRVLLVIVGYLVVFGALGWSFATGRESLAAVTLYLLMAGQVWRLAPSFNDLSRLAIGAAPMAAARKAVAAGNAAVGQRDGRPEVAVLSPHGAAPDGPPCREIRFEQTSFAYPGGRLVLRDLDLAIEVGRSTAIVGANGAGKTTLVKLLCGLYEPSAGRITVDGVDLRERGVGAWRGQVSAVFQDYVHYPVTVGENVAWGAGGAIDEEGVRLALAEADATELVDSLPAGLDTPLGRDFDGGVELSGGQWQKIAVARALAALHTGASVLILDEPTANLDVRSEAALFERILSVTRGQTTLLVSHRLANVRRADRIVVLSDGQVVEEGPHEDLMAINGTYAQLFQMQAARFRETTASGSTTRQAGSA
ncbi:ABC transporter ATP-binding protein [Micromonospora tulbaghiae]|uniref:ABC transporter ATP-binding protein n=1 Tax=Micromonospora tulbaghiae TaxID=479978 RepID=UPI003655DC03